MQSPAYQFSCRNIISRKWWEVYLICIQRSQYLWMTIFVSDITCAVVFVQRPKAANVHDLISELTVLFPIDLLQGILYCSERRFEDCRVQQALGDSPQCRML